MFFFIKFDEKRWLMFCFFKVFHFSGCLRPVFDEHFPFFVLPNLL